MSCDRGRMSELVGINFFDELANASRNVELCSMGEKKIKISKNWYEDTSESLRINKTAALLEQIKTTKADELPDWMSAKDVAPKVGTTEKTASAWMKSGIIKSVKIRGRRYSTAQWVSEYLKKEILKNG